MADAGKDLSMGPPDQEHVDQDSIEDLDVSKRTLTVRNRKPSEKARENMTTELTDTFFKLCDKYSRKINDAERELGAHCTAEALVEIKTSLEREFQWIEALFEELKQTSITALDQNIRLSMDRLQSDKDALVAAAERKHMMYGDKSCNSSLPSVTSQLSSPHSRKSGSSSASSKALDAAANAAARRAELIARIEEDSKHEELDRLELEETKRRAESELLMQRKRRELEQGRIQKELRIEEAKAKIYNDELDREDAQSKLFVGERCNVSAQPNQPTNDLSALAGAFAAAMSLSRLPMPEPSVFDGDHLEYHDWSIAFKVLIEDKGISEADKINYLKRYVGGSAREAISGYFLLRSTSAFERARAVLEERYGNAFIVTEAFRDKLDAWPRVRDGIGLRRFSDFLNQCQAAMVDMKGLEILNDSRENRKLLQKLPDWIISRWGRVASDSKKRYGAYPSFCAFADFISEEANIACDPVTSLDSLRDVTDERKKASTPARTLASDAHFGETESCLLCKKGTHLLTECRTFGEKSAEEKQAFVMKNGLCFGCLRHGHMSKNCMGKSLCKICQKRHPTSLHTEQKPNDNTQEAMCRKVLKGGKGAMSAMIVPVWISAKDNPETEQLVYALLDTQSDTTFEETANALNSKYETAKLLLSTMSVRDNLITCKRFKGLQIRSFEKNVTIDLPDTYSRDFIPTNRGHIPTSAAADKWPHLKQMSHLIPPMQKCEIGLLIGYNCPLALAPINCITGHGNQPFAIQTDLGWSVVGGTDPHDDCDHVGVSHRIVVKAIQEQLQPETNSGKHREDVRFIDKTTVKEVTNMPHAEIRRIQEEDFAEDRKAVKIMSQDDIMFSSKVATGIHQQQDGYYSMPLPFRTRPCLPDNRHVAMRRAERFLTNDKYHQHYRTTGHLFGASSSPACANYGQKQIGNDYGKDSPDTAHFVRRSFYVDDRLTSVDNIDKAKILIKQTRKMCAKGNPRVQQFMSNSIEVLESVPGSERAKNINDLDVFLEYMPVEGVPRQPSNATEMESKAKKPAHRRHCIVERGRPCTLSLETSKGRRYNGKRRQPCTQGQTTHVRSHSLEDWQKSEGANVPGKAYPQVGTTVNRFQR